MLSRAARGEEDEVESWCNVLDGLGRPKDAESERELLRRCTGLGAEGGAAVLPLLVDCGELPWREVPVLSVPARTAFGSGRAAALVLTGSGTSLGAVTRGSAGR